MLSTSLRRSGHVDDNREVFRPVEHALPRRTNRLTCLLRGGESNMSSFFKSLSLLSKRDEGQTMAEYGVVLAVITLAVVVALAALSGAISDALDAVTGIL
jgi:Flp pilus assembly pilin Flp